MLWHPSAFPGFPAVFARLAGRRLSDLSRSPAGGTTYPCPSTQLYPSRSRSRSRTPFTRAGRLAGFIEASFCSAGTAAAAAGFLGDRRTTAAAAGSDTAGVGEAAPASMSNRSTSQSTLVAFSPACGQHVHNVSESVPRVNKCSACGIPAAATAAPGPE